MHCAHLGLVLCCLELKQLQNSELFYFYPRSASNVLGKMIGNRVLFQSQCFVLVFVKAVQWKTWKCCAARCWSIQHEWSSPVPTTCQNSYALSSGRNPIQSKRLFFGKKVMSQKRLFFGKKIGNVYNLDVSWISKRCKNLISTRHFVQLWLCMLIILSLATTYLKNVVESLIFLSDEFARYASLRYELRYCLALRIN